MTSLAESTQTILLLFESLLYRLEHAPVEVQAVRAHLAFLCLKHPLLLPYREDPLLDFEGRFLSLDAHQGSLEAVCLQYPLPNIYTESAVGMMACTLYLPARKEAIAGRVLVTVLPLPPHAPWENPEFVHSVSRELKESAQRAQKAALAVLYASKKSDYSQSLHPSRLIVGLDFGLDYYELLGEVAGDSLDVPIALAMLSALTHCAVLPSVAATGGLGKAGVAMVSSVDSLAEKAACLPPETQFFTPENAESLAYIAQNALSQGELFIPRTLLPVSPPQVNPLFFVTVLEDKALIDVASDSDTFNSNSFNSNSFNSNSFNSNSNSLERESFFSRLATGLNAYFIPERRGFSLIWDLNTNILPALKTLLLQASAQGIAVRIGVHLGEGTFQQGRYEGTGPERALLLAEVCPINQILVSENVAAHFPEAVGAFLSQGKHRLRDQREEHLLFQFWQEGLPELFVPPYTLSGRRNNLPTFESRMHGREEERLYIIEHLRPVKTRLLTITGPGGVGKTRLAVQAAASVLEDFAGGVWFISLADGMKSDEITQQLAQNLGISGSSEEEQWARLISLLSAQRMLLVLDNFESVLSPASGGTEWVLRLLSESTTTQILVTSRNLLGLRDEHRFAVLPFSMKEAMTFFLERSHLANLSNMTEEEEETLKVICQRLDALPLALELAAARLTHLSLTDLATRLEKALPLLTTRLKDVPERHRTLWNTLEWSWQSLERAEQALLCLLALFPSGATLTALEEIAGDSLGPLLLDSLAILEESSLVQCQVRFGASSTRYTLLSLIREFALEKSHQIYLGDQYEENRLAYARYFARFAHARRDWNSWLRPENEAFFRDLHEERVNLSAAFTILRENNDPLLLPLVAGRVTYWIEMGLMNELKQAVPIACARTNQTDDPSVLSILYRGYSSIMRREARYEEALLFLEKSKEQALRIGNTEALAINANLEGLIYSRLNDLKTAEAAYQNSLSLFESLESPRGYVHVLSNLGYSVFQQQDFPRALSLYEAGYKIAREKGSIQEQLRMLSRLTSYYYECHEASPLALELGERFLALSQKNARPMTVAEAQINYGSLLTEVGQFDAAILLFFCAEELLKRQGHPWQEVVRENMEEIKSHFSEEYFEKMRLWARRQDENVLFSAPPDIILAL